MPRGFIDLYDRHFDSVYGYLCNELGDATAAESAVCDVFVTAARDLHRFEGASPWTTQEWLLAIAQDLVGATEREARCGRRRRTDHVSSTRPSPAGRARARRPGR